MSKRPGFARLQSMSSYDDLVALASGDDKGSLAQFEPSLNDKAIEISIDALHDFPNHPFKVIDDEAMKSLADSIRNRGVLHPIVVRKIDDGYQVISGHRRKMACVKAGLDKVPAYVIDLDDDEAIMLMTDANFYQREGLFPSEKAKAYRMKSDAIKRHPGIKGKYTIDEIGEGTSDSAATIKRFLRLSYLSDELLDMVDEGIIGLEQGLQISYINDELQEQIKEVIEQAQVKMTVEHSKRLRQAYANGVLDKALIWEILMSVPPKKRKFVLKEELLRKYFDEEIPDEEIEGVIELALEKYFEKGEL